MTINVTFKLVLSILFVTIFMKGFAQYIHAPQLPQFESNANANQPHNTPIRQPQPPVQQPPVQPSTIPVEKLLSEFQPRSGTMKKMQANARVGLTDDFFDALSVLDSMLKGHKQLSVADAFFATEQAYGNTYMNYKDYKATIKKSAQFIRQWMDENGLDGNDNYMQHYAIQKFMSAPLTVYNTTTEADKIDNITAETHEPFYYDYDDYGGEQDPRNLFVTKCLATGYGQCRSMPIVYLLLAEEMGIEAYLSFAPNHSFVKYPDNDGYIINYEATSNWKISNNWYADNLSILPEALRSGIYLDTLGPKKIVANCMFDLANEYMRSNGPDTNFILFCLGLGTPYFPRNNNLQSLLVHQMYLRTLLAEEMDKHNITEYEEIKTVPSAAYYHNLLLNNLSYLKKLGYYEMPADRYDALLKEHEFKGRMQTKMNVDTKQKRDLFSKSSQ